MGVCTGVKCGNCPFTELGDNHSVIDCTTNELECPEKAIEIVKKWSEEHPILTNKDKYIEVMNKTFGVDIEVKDDCSCSPLRVFNGCSGYGCNDCTNWWNQEYTKK